MTTFLQRMLTLSILIALAWFGKSILLPLIFALLLWVIVTSWNRVFKKISLFGYKIPYWLQSTVSLLAFLLLISFLADLVASEFSDLSRVYPELEKNIQTQAQKIHTLTGFDIATYFQKYASSFMDKIDIAGLAQNIANGISSAFGTIFTVLIYLMFIFGEQKYFQAKLKAASGKDYSNQKQILQNILSSIQKYISIKTSTSFLTALLSYTVMSVVGLKFPLVWAFIIFILNFVPSIGSLIATVFPVLFALIYFPTWWPALILLVSIGAIQVLVGNIIEPKYMGKELNISPLLVIFSLFFWGALWGVPGMFLSVPLTVIIMIILLAIPSTKKIGIWMSGDGIV